MASYPEQSLPDLSRFNKAPQSLPDLSKFNQAKPEPRSSYSQSELEDILRRNGWDENNVPKMAAIGMAEAALDKQGRALVNSHNPGRTTPEDSYGIWQINMAPNLKRAYDKQRLASDPDYNAQVALEIYNNSRRKNKFDEWGAHYDGRYKKFFTGNALSAPGVTIQDGAAPDITPASISQQTEYDPKALWPLPGQKPRETTPQEDQRAQRGTRIPGDILSRPILFDKPELELDPVQAKLKQDYQDYVVQNQLDPNSPKSVDAFNTKLAEDHKKEFFETNYKKFLSIGKKPDTPENRQQFQNILDTGAQLSLQQGVDVEQEIAKQAPKIVAPPAQAEVIKGKYLGKDLRGVPQPVPGQDPIKTGLLRTQTGGTLKRVTDDPTYGVPPQYGEERFVDDNGQTYLYDKTSDTIKDESLSKIAVTVPVAKSPRSIGYAQAKEAYITQASSNLAAAVNQSGLTHTTPNDVYKWLSTKNITKFNTDIPLGEEELFAPDGSPVPGEGQNTQNARTSDFHLTGRELNDLVSYLKNANQFRKEYVSAKIAHGAQLSEDEIKDLGLDVNEFKNSPEYYQAIQRAPETEASVKHQADLLRKSGKYDDVSAPIQARADLGIIDQDAAKTEIDAYNNLKARFSERYKSNEAMAKAGLVDPENDARLQRLLKADITQTLKRFGSFTNYEYQQKLAEQQEQDRLERLKKDPWYKYAVESSKSAFFGLNKAIAEGGADMFEGAAVYTKPWADYIDSVFGTKSSKISEHPFTKFSSWLKGLADYALPTNPDYDKNIPGRWGKGVGSSIAFMPSAYGGPLGIALFASLQQAGGDFDEKVTEGKQRGVPVSEDEAAAFARLDATLTGWTENFGFGNMFKRFLESPGATTFRHMALDALQEAAEETILNEGPQELTNNLLTQLTFDPTREWDDGIYQGVLDAGGSAVLASVLTSGLLHIKHRRDIQKLATEQYKNGGQAVFDLGKDGLFINGKRVNEKDLSEKAQEMLGKHREYQQEIQGGLDELDKIKQRLLKAPLEDRAKIRQSFLDVKKEIEATFKQQQKYSLALAKLSGIPGQTLAQQAPFHQLRNPSPVVPYTQPATRYTNEEGLQRAKYAQDVSTGNQFQVAPGISDLEQQAAIQGQIQQKLQPAIQEGQLQRAQQAELKVGDQVSTPKGLGRIVQSKGKNWVVEYNPTNKNGQIVYQSRSEMRKHLVEPFDQELPDLSQFNQQEIEKQEAPPRQLRIVPEVENTHQEAKVEPAPEPKVEVKPEPPKKVKKAPPLTPQIKVEDIHKLAEEKGIDHNSQAFQKLSKDLTGSAKLDAMNQSQLKKVQEGINGGRFEKAKIEPKATTKFKKGDEVILPDGTYGTVQRYDKKDPRKVYVENEDGEIVPHREGNLKSDELLKSVAKRAQEPHISKFTTDSKVKHVVYHGGIRFDADEFDSGHSAEVGFHFGDLEQANDRIHTQTNPNDLASRKAVLSSSILPVVIKLKNPIQMPDIHFWGVHETAQELHSKGILSKKEVESIKALNTKEGKEKLYRTLESKGYDGFEYLNENEGETHKPSYAVFRANQIKSVFNKQEQIDHTDSNLLKAAADKIKALGATGTAAQWINRNEKEVKDWQKYLKNHDGLSVLGNEVELNFKKASREGEIQMVAQTDLNNYLKNLSEQNVNVENENIQQALWAYKSDPKGATARLESFVMQERERILDEWKSYIDKENNFYKQDPFFKDLIWNDLTKVRKDRPDLPMPLDKAALAAVWDDIKWNPNSTSFEKLYNKKIKELMLEDAKTADILKVPDGTWIKIPQTDRDHPDFSKNVGKVQAISNKAWCTSQGMAQAYLPYGDFWVLVKNNKSELALRFSGGAVAEIQGQKNDGTIPEEYLPDVKDLIRSGKIELTISSIDQVLDAIRTAKFNAKSLAYNKEVEKLAEKYGGKAWYTGGRPNEASTDIELGIDKSINLGIPNANYSNINDLVKRLKEEPPVFESTPNDTARRELKELFLKHFDENYKEPVKKKTPDTRNFNQVLRDEIDKIKNRKIQEMISLGVGAPYFHDLDLVEQDLENKDYRYRDQAIEVFNEDLEAEGRRTLGTEDEWTDKEQEEAKKEFKRIIDLAYKTKPLSERTELKKKELDKELKEPEKTFSEKLQDVFKQIQKEQGKVVTDTVTYLLYELDIPDAANVETNPQYWLGDDQIERDYNELTETYNSQVLGANVSGVYRALSHGSDSGNRLPNNVANHWDNLTVKEKKEFAKQVETAAKQIFDVYFKEQDDLKARLQGELNKELEPDLKTEKEKGEAKFQEITAKFHDEHYDAWANWADPLIGEEPEFTQYYEELKHSRINPENDSELETFIANNNFGQDKFDPRHPIMQLDKQLYKEAVWPALKVEIEQKQKELQKELDNTFDWIHKLGAGFKDSIDQVFENGNFLHDLGIEDEVTPDSLLKDPSEVAEHLLMHPDIESFMGHEESPKEDDVFEYIIQKIEEYAKNQKEELNKELAPDLPELSGPAQELFNDFIEFLDDSEVVQSILRDYSPSKTPNFEEMTSDAVEEYVKEAGYPNLDNEEYLAIDRHIEHYFETHWDEIKKLYDKKEAELDKELAPDRTKLSKILDKIEQDYFEMRHKEGDQIQKWEEDAFNSLREHIQDHDPSYFEMPHGFAPFTNDENFDKRIQDEFLTPLYEEIKKEKRAELDKELNDLSPAAVSEINEIVQAVADGMYSENPEKAFESHLERIELYLEDDPDEQSLKDSVATLEKYKDEIIRAIRPGLEKLLAEKKAELDKELLQSKAKNYHQVAFQIKDDPITPSFIKNITVKTDKDGNLHMSSHAAELLRQIEKDMEVLNGKTDSDPAPFVGTVMRQGQLNVYTAALRDLIAHAPKEVTKSQLKPITKLYTALKAAKKGVVLYVDKTELPHEATHSIRYELSGFKEFVHQYYKDFDALFKKNGVAITKAYNAYFKHVYFQNAPVKDLSRLAKSHLYEELITHILTENVDLGLTQAEQDKIIADDVTAFIEQNGPGIIPKLERWIQNEDKKQVFKAASSQKLSQATKSPSSGRGKGSEKATARNTEREPAPPRAPADVGPQESGNKERRFPITANKYLAFDPADLHFNARYYSPIYKSDIEQQAYNWLRETGIQDAYNDVFRVEPTALGSAKRIAVLSYLDAQIEDFTNQGNLGRAEAVYDKMMDLLNVISPQMTEWGQAISQLSKWSYINPAKAIAYISSRKRKGVDLKQQQRLRDLAKSIRDSDEGISEIQAILRDSDNQYIEESLQEALKLKPKALENLKEFFDANPELLKAVPLTRTVDKLLRDPKFRRAFKNTKIVDKKGNPQLVYRGNYPYPYNPKTSHKELEHQNLFGGYYTTHPEVAEYYSIGAQPDSPRQGGRTYAGFLNITNPITIHGGTDDLMIHIHEGIEDGTLKVDPKKGVYIPKNWKPAKELHDYGYGITPTLKEGWYDGIVGIAHAGAPDLGSEIIAFHPGQFKGLFNQGSWNFHSSDMLKSAAKSFKDYESHPVFKNLSDAKQIIIGQYLAEIDHALNTGEIEQQDLDFFAEHLANDYAESIVLNRRPQGEDAEEASKSLDILYGKNTEKYKQEVYEDMKEAYEKEFGWDSLLKSAAKKSLAELPKNFPKAALIALGKAKLLEGRKAGGQTLDEWKNSVINEMASVHIDSKGAAPYMDDLYVKVRQEVTNDIRKKKLENLQKKENLTEAQAYQRIVDQKAAAASKVKLEATNLKEAKGPIPKKEKLSALEVAIQQHLGPHATFGREDILRSKNQREFYKHYAQKGLKPADITPLYLDAVQILLDANESLKAVKQEHRMQRAHQQAGITAPDLPPAEKAKYERELVQKQKDRARNIKEFNDAVKFLTNEPETRGEKVKDWYLRMNRAGETSLTGAVTTITHNVISQEGVKLLNAIETGFELALAKSPIANWFSEDELGISKDASFKDIAKGQFGSFYSPQAAKQAWKDRDYGLMATLMTAINAKEQMVQGVLAYNPDLYNAMIGKFTFGDDFLKKYPIENYNEGAERNIEKGVRKVESWVHFWTQLNGLQEKHFRFATFLASVAIDLKAKGIDPDEVLKKGNLDLADRKVLERAVMRALEDTFGGDITNRYVNQLSNWMGWLPFAINPMLFRRFLWNSTKYTFEHSPLMAAKLISPFHKFTRRDMAKLINGTFMYTLALGILAAFGSDDDDPTLLTIWGHHVKIASYNPLATWLRFAMWTRRYFQGKEIIKGPDELLALFGYDSRYPNQALEFYKAVIEWGAGTELRRSEKLAQLGKAAAGRTVSAYLHPLSTFKAIAQQFDDLEREQRDYYEEPFLGEIKRQIPESERIARVFGNSTPSKEKPETGDLGPGDKAEVEKPLLNQVGWSEVPERETGAKLTPAEDYLDNQLDKKREKDKAFFKTPEEKRATAITAQLYHALDKGVFDNNPEKFEKRVYYYADSGQITKQQQQNLFKSAEKDENGNIVGIKPRLDRMAEQSTIPMLVNAWKYAKGDEKETIEYYLDEKAKRQTKNNSLDKDEVKLLKQVFPDFEESE